MNEILVKKVSKKVKVVFYPERVVKYKKDCVQYEIYLSEMQRVEYHQKLKFSDVLCWFTVTRVPNALAFCIPKMLTISTTLKKPKIFTLKLKPEEYLLLKEKFLKPIELT